MLDIVIFAGIIGMIIAFALIGYFIYWLKTKNVTYEDIKVIYEEIEIVKTSVTELNNAIKAGMVIPSNGNGHKEEIPVPVPVGTKEVSFLDAVNELQEKHEEEQPVDLPTPEEQQQTINDRMAKARAARKPRVVK